MARRIGTCGKTRLLTILFVVTLALPAHAVPNLTKHCIDPRSRQFDFWLGSFRVRNYAGQLEGRDSITRAYGDCVIQERFWSSDGASFGSSFSFFDARTQEWHYVWVDNLGAFEMYSGGRIGKSMVLEGQTRSKLGAIRLERMTWEPIGRGRVRQLWQTSNDSGKQWHTISDVYYWPIQGR